MSLNDAIDKLKEITDEATEFHGALMELAKRGEDVSKGDKDKIRRLAERLDGESRAAARARRQAEIEEVEAIIKAHDLTLTVPDLSADVRAAVKADRVAKLARLARLKAQEGTDFGGVLTADEAAKLADLVQEVRAEAEKKKAAGAFLALAVRIMHLAWSIAAKLAM
jgi:hypothetical protein